MSVTWAATAPESGRFCAVERCSDMPELTDRFGELRSRGRGYLEVRLPDAEFPLLTLGFQGDRAVLHLFGADDTVFLLAGDGTTAADTVLDVPVMDDLAAFGGDVILAVERAWDLVCRFVATGAPGRLGEWHGV